MSHKESELSKDIVIMLLAYGSELIQKGGILLKLNAVTIATGQSILHKFYFNHSLRKFNIRTTAAAACLLSCKLEENHRKVNHIVKVFEFLQYYEGKHKCSSSGQDFDNLSKTDILIIEKEILVEFAFRLDEIIVSPHRYVLQYTYALFRNLDQYTSQSVDQLAQRAWGYLNDSMRTSLICEIEPGVIAVGCIYLASASLGIPLKKDTLWFEVFNATWNDVIQVCKALDHLYSMGPVYYIDVNRKLS
ncbi:cyclin, putative [Theileria equi strain WA]|uniref:Cyclin, putative n=1 Tax=Theileria equi strain WA TaxID=1537102 RepID=L1LGJ3_THEEQ|nr:cyclin, putative [Theileria equi strain WA]EKX74243.1 cyclin, putative [Theileria equi strain WA]|eukprot:XP_004833695.1 cyclin, putative [Theileria equi strain WA]